MCPYCQIVGSWRKSPTGSRNILAQFRSIQYLHVFAAWFIHDVALCSGHIPVYITAHVTATAMRRQEQPGGFPGFTASRQSILGLLVLAYNRLISCWFMHNTWYAGKTWKLWIDWFILMRFLWAARSLNCWVLLMLKKSGPWVFVISSRCWFFRI